MAPEASDSCDQTEDQSAETNFETDKSLPDWVQIDNPDWGEKLQVDEWRLGDGGAYRRDNGWRGKDLVHDVDSPVRILEYFVKYGPGIETSPQKGTTSESPVYKSFSKGGIGTMLTGIVHFTRRAESHKGFCHGGSMCSIMDDVIGWVGFLTTGECLPWSGFTVQVNSRLQKPVKVGSFLLIEAKITNIERRKVSIEAVLKDPTKTDETANVHATASGLVVLNRGILCEPIKDPQGN